MNKRFLVLACATGMLIYSCQEPNEAIISPNRTLDSLNQSLSSLLEENSENGSLDFFILPEPDALDEIPQDPKNPLNPAKVELGKLLFHETGLAVNPDRHTSMFEFSCSSCHPFQAGFQAGMRQGIGEGGMGFGLAGEARKVKPEYTIFEEIDVLPLRVPSLLNSAFQKNVLWNGQFGATGVNAGTEALWVADTILDANLLGFEGLETQALEGIDVHRMRIENSVADSLSTYKTLFAEAFPGEEINKLTGALALAAYERTLLSTEAPFQSWLKGDKQALTHQQLQGAILFFGEAGCVSCHTGPALNSMTFHALGMGDLVGEDVIGAINAAGRYGRGSFSQKTEDLYKFKTPQLYNLKDSPFYGHGGTFTSVEEVVRYKNRAIPENPNVPDVQLAAEFIPLGLSDDQIHQITDFIEHGLRDPNLQRYVPESLPSSMCFPNADSVSKKDLSCN